MMLLRQKEELERAQKVARIGSWSYDPKTRMPTWSKEMFRIFGLEPAPEAPQYDFHRKIIHPEDWERFDRAVTLAVSEGRGYNLELRIALPDGNIRILNARCEAVRDAKGRVSELIGTTQDITEQTRVLNLLKQSEERFRTSIETLLDCFGIFSAIRNGAGEIEDFRVEYVNAAACENNRMSKEEQVGGRLCQMLPAHRTTGLFDDYRRVVETGVPFKKRALFYEDDFNGKHLKRAFDIQATRLADGFAVCWRDVTEAEQKRRESAYHMRQAIQADRLAALGEVVAGVAHEINNPNSFITYNVPLLKDIWEILEPVIREYAAGHPVFEESGLKPHEIIQDMKEVIDSIGIGSERISKVVMDLKDFARLDEGPEFKPVSLDSVIEKTMTIVGAQLRRSAETVETLVDQDLPKVHGHFGRIEQVLANLLTNAGHVLKRQKGSTITLRARYIHRLSAVLLEVEDNGPGMPSEVLERIFEPFFTTRRATGGTGLGLSISHSIVEEHSGILGVQSRPGIGTCFKVFLPRNRNIRLKLEPTILCVDDEPALLSMLQSYFLKANHAPVEVIEHPEKVLEYLENHPEVDVVLSDIRMPHVNGWALLDRIKRRFPLLPVFLFSGHTEELTSGSAASFVPDGLFEKPFDLKLVLNRIENVGRCIL